MLLNISVILLFIAEKYSFEWLCHYLFICSPVGGRVCWFLFWLLDKVPINSHVNSHLCMVLFLLGKHLGMK